MQEHRFGWADAAQHGRIGRIDALRYQCCEYMVDIRVFRVPEELFMHVAGKFCDRCSVDSGFQL
jgi:hypothetical protein